MLKPDIRETILKCVSQHISPKRLAHVLRVEQKAIELARQYAICVEDCQCAALLHDLAKEWSMEEYTAVVKRYGLDEAMLPYGSEILHGPVAACVIEEWFGITSLDIKDAIAYHTIGKGEMNPVAKVLFVADYIEDGRTFLGVEKARQLAKESLEQAIMYKLSHSLTYLIEQNVRIYPDTILAYNEWVLKCKGETCENK